ncbi:MAG: CatB-related O-acetyltransferase [Bacteroidetes bacterium]|nr:CatB-related O-acetyltransferase [Bacteroidota bacterium]
MNLIEKITLNFRALKRLVWKERERMFLEKEQHSKKFMTFKNVELVNSYVGKYSYVANNSIIHNCEIGKFCSIGPNVVIGYGEHPLSFISTSPVFYENPNMFGEDVYSPNSFNGKQKVIIENDVWIGANVYIKNGVTVGNGAVIGSGAVVTKSVPPYAVVIGVPAKIFKYRFSEEEIKKLLEIKWWNWDIDKIKKHKNYFTKTKLNDFFNNISK